MRALIDRLGYVPETCVWEITRACNLRCGHCGTGAGRARPDELTTSEAVDVARQLARLGNRLTSLSGGEPTLRPDWPTIAATLIDSGVTVNMVTNGQSDGRRLAEQVGEVGLANVAVSIDGLEPTHDALRAPGTFARARDTILHLVAAGIWVDVMCTVNRWNLDQLSAIWQQAKDWGARGFRVQLGKPMGNQTHREDLTLVPEHLLTLLPVLGRLAQQRGPVVRIGDSVGYYSPEERVLRGRYTRHEHWTGCYAGMRAIGIQADGGVKGCLSLQPRAGEPDRFVEGNLREHSLADIWFRPGAFAYNREADLGELTGACARCSHATLCRGGAKCVAYTYTGETGCDPMCYCHVARLHEATQMRIWPVSASAAAAALLVSAGGCGPRVEADYGVRIPPGAGADQGGTVNTGGATTGGVTTGGTTIQPDYGVVYPEYGLPEPGGATGWGGTGGEFELGGADTGGRPQTGGALTGGVTAGGVGGAQTGGAQSGGAAMSGASGSPAGAEPSVAGAAGNPIETGGMMVAGAAGLSAVAGTAGASGAGPIDCSSVCCDCEYGIIPPAVFRACCCENVCCMCDYGGPPPAGCCP